VAIVRGDDFCEDRDIRHIDFMKADTEGADLDVLCGFLRMLSTEDIDVVQVEAGMYAGSPRHVPFHRFTGYLEPMGYHLFRIYGPMRDFRGMPVFARCDLVFISDAVVQGNPRSVVSPVDLGAATRTVSGHCYARAA